MRGEVPTIRPAPPTPLGDAEWFAQSVGRPRPTLRGANRQSSIRNHQSEAVYEYDVYGQVAASDPNHPNRFLFTGREFDKETGLYYYRARYYNPTIGRFLQTDPIGYEDGLNMYTYCSNNPSAFSDPSGLYRICWGLQTTEEQKSYILASFKRVRTICDNRIQEIGDLLSMIRETSEVNPVYDVTLLQELATLRYVLKQIRDGIDSDTERLIVRVGDLGEERYGIYNPPWPEGTSLTRFPVLTYSSRYRSPAPNCIDMDVTTLHELSHKYGTADTGDGWMNAYFLEKLVEHWVGEDFWFKYYWSLMFRDPATGICPKPFDTSDPQAWESPN